MTWLVVCIIELNRGNEHGSWKLLCRSSSYYTLHLFLNPLERKMGGYILSCDLSRVHAAKLKEIRITICLRELNFSIVSLDTCVRQLIGSKHVWICWAFCSTSFHSFIMWSYPGWWFLYWIDHALYISIISLCSTGLLASSCYNSVFLDN